MIYLKNLPAYLFAFLLPWQTIFLVREVFVGGEKWQYGTIGVYGFEVALLLWIVVAVVQKKVHFSASGIIALIFALWCALSSLWATDATLALSQASVILFGAAMLLLPLSDKKSTVAVFLISLSLIGAIALGQFFAQESISCTLLGMSAHDASAGGASVIEALGERWLRAYGALPHPNMLGGFLAVGIILLFPFLKKTKTNIYYTTALFVFALLFSALLVTFSRSALLGCVVGATALFFLRRKSISARVFIAPILLALGIGVLFLFAYTPLFLTRAAVEGRLEEKSLTDRSAANQEAASIMWKHPIIGVGAGNSTAVIIQKNPTESVWKIQPAHNLFLLIGSETGIIGAVLFLALVFTFLSSALKGVLSGTRAVALSAIAAILTISFFDHWIWTTASGVILLFFLLALSQPLSNETRYAIKRT